MHKLLRRVIHILIAGLFAGCSERGQDVMGPTRAVEPVHSTSVEPIKENIPPVLVTGPSPNGCVSAASLGPLASWAFDHVPTGARWEVAYAFDDTGEACPNHHH
jgi:hypothetical protein